MLKELEKIFRTNGIDFAAPGFYNHPNFLAIEQNSPRFLDSYGLYVRHRMYCDEYLNSVRTIIPEIAKIFFDELSATELKQRRCVDISNAFVKILEMHEIWAFSAAGSLRVDYPPTSDLERAYWWHCDDLPTIEQTTNMPGHVWILCPPFQIIDLTLKYQGYKQGEEQYLPDFVLAEEVERFQASLEDICSPEYRAHMKVCGVTEQDFFEQTLFSHFSTNMYPASYMYEGTRISYIPFRFGGLTETTIDKIYNLTFSDLSVREVYDKKILKIFQKYDM